jgi:hypothetical protein
MERKLGVFLWVNLIPAATGRPSLKGKTSIAGAPAELGEAGGLTVLSLLAVAGSTKDRRSADWAATTEANMSGVSASVTGRATTQGGSVILSCSSWSICNIAELPSRLEAIAHTTSLSKAGDGEDVLRCFVCTPDPRTGVE